MTDSITGTNFIAIATWFAPSPLFILVNLVIGTIALVSCFNAVPKIKIIQRAKSFNTRHYYNHQEQTSSITKPESRSESTQPQVVQISSLLKRVVSFNLSLHKLAPPHVKTHDVQPEPENSSAELDPKLVCDSGDEEKRKTELKRSVSEKECSMTLDWEEEEDEEALERRRPSTAMARSETTTCKEDEGVDAKADDFINMFKKQLKLQRLNSFIRYRNKLTLPFE
ncbi:pathogen-associated molecular patterns-induced protein A70-like [Lathyrus oleraceus]|uniref:pathogen-associated molecular patterns-induced protein A70-like n=1 Tax=Pisum sativum TaxID=3888 RepID=UPI0021D3D6AB|nr:pathogen-associated molecular patterns-induced protein A70-like [Pisum sativum]